MVGSVTLNCCHAVIQDYRSQFSLLDRRHSPFKGIVNCHLRFQIITSLHNSKGVKVPDFYEGHNNLPAKASRGFRCITRFAGKKFVKKSKTYENVEVSSPSNEVNTEADQLDPSPTSSTQESSRVPSRSNVLQACTITSGLIAVFGIGIRQVFHVASQEGLPVLDCVAEVSFDFEIWHLQLIAELVLLVSSCRYLLLKIWPDFAESSEAANKQVLSSLQPLDYVIVAFLPGISEELLFRGALVPIFGFDLKSVLLVAIIFGVLHLGSGRKYSFAVWATFVGISYGLATIASSSMIVPMASHAVNNLIGGILWRYTSSSPSK